MAPNRKLAQALGIVLAAFLSPVSAAVSLDICAGFNTADMNKELDIYMTNGLCKEHCLENYAYAITQYQSCWCSNYGPDEASELDKSKCSTPCPAYPDFEKCGGPNAFGYILMGNVEPLGTKGPAGDDSSSKPTKSDESDETSSTDPPTRIETVTADGTVKTVIVSATGSTNSSESDENTNGSQSTEGKKGLSTGAVAGIVVGVILVVVIAAGFAILWFLRRKKRSREESEFQNDPSVGSTRGGSPGTVTTAGPEMMGTSSAANTIGNRNSVMNIDPRMDPVLGQGLYGGRSGSQESLNSLQDNRDYTRRLRVMNPNPAADTDK
jgi:cell wall integrity and stress response component